MEEDGGGRTAPSVGGGKVGKDSLPWQTGTIDLGQQTPKSPATVVPARMSTSHPVFWNLYATAILCTQTHSDRLQTVPKQMFITHNTITIIQS